MRREGRLRPLRIDVAQPSSERQGTARRPLLRHRRYGSGPGEAGVVVELATQCEKLGHERGRT